MNGLSTSIQNTSARRVTDVAQVIVATGLDAVCKAGPWVAMHFATAGGIVVVRVPLVAFVEKAQAARDHHGRPFALPISTLERDASVVPITKGAPERFKRPYAGDGRGNRYGTRGLPQAVRDKLLWAFQNNKGGGDTARDLKISENTVYTYFRRFRETAALRAPIAKPNGQLL